MAIVVEECVDGFKAIESTCVKFDRGVNLLVGPSSSGKSSLLEAMALIMQSRGEDALIIEGRFLTIHDIVDIIRGLNPSRMVSIALRFSIDESMMSLLKDVGIDASGDVKYVYSFTHSAGDVVQELWYNDRLLVAFGRVNGSNILIKPTKASLCITPYHVINEDSLELCTEVNFDDIRVAKAMLYALRESLKDRFFFISENRLAWWKRSFETSVDLMPEYSVGGDAQYTVHHLSRILTIPSYRAELFNILSELAPLGVEELTAGFVESNRIMGYIKSRGYWGVLYNAGLGIRSILPVIVQLIIAPRGSILVVDGVDIGLDEEALSYVISVLKKYALLKDMQIIAASRSMPSSLDGVNVVRLSGSRKVN